MSKAECFLGIKMLKNFRRSDNNGAVSGKILPRHTKKDRWE